MSYVERVFILGAGMSVPLGIPAAKDLLSSIVKVLDDGESASSEELIALLGYLYPTFKSSGVYPDIEDVLALIDVGMEAAGTIDDTEWPKWRLAGVRKILTDAIARFMWLTMSVNARKYARGDDSAWRPMRELVKNYAAGVGVIVTFNWDLNVELAAMDSGNAYSYGITEDAPVRIVKPHGSINWFENGAEPSGIQGLERLGSNLWYYAYFFGGRFKFVRAAPLIVPPTPFKTFQLPELQQMWRDAYASVSMARSIHILGYRLPPEDQWARWMLTGAIRANVRRGRKPPRVEVVNRDASVVTRVRGLVGDDAEVFDGGRSCEEWQGV